MQILRGLSLEKNKLRKRTRDYVLIQKEINCFDTMRINMSTTVHKEEEKRSDGDQIIGLST